MVVLSCGKQSAHNPMQTLSSITTQANQPANVRVTINILPSLPLDTVQPWEKVDSRGFVVKTPSHSISGLYPDSEYQSGVDRFKDDTVSKENGEAIRLSSGTSGEKKIAWAMWRLVMGGTQPGVITLDANLGSADAKYFVAVSDYKRNCWQWLGEFDTPHAIIPMKSGEYLSKLGNAFVVVLSYNGASVDVVGAGAHPVTSSDTTPPADVTNPKAEAVPGGLLLSWDKVAAADLAGYQISIGNKPINSLTNTTYALIPYTSGKLTITAIDTNNNSSNPVEIIVPSTLVSGDIPGIYLTTDITGIQRNGKTNLKVISDLTGAKFDFDLNGDGVFEVLDNVTGSVSPTYPDTGILRPAVCAVDSSGFVRAFSAVSLIVSSNARPVVDITVDKSYGQAPLDVKYTAEFQDFDGTVTQLWWDANGDGTYEAPIATPTSPATTSTSLSRIGITNARVRVADNDGATDVANVSVQIVNNPYIGDWTMFGREPTHNRRSPFNGPEAPFVNWVYYIGSSSGEAAISKSGVIYFGSTNNKLYAINSDGSLKWTFDTGDMIVFSSPAIGADETIYIGSTDKYLYAINPDGKLKWKYAVGSRIRSSVVIGSDGTIYFGCMDGYLYAVNPDGSNKWLYFAGCDIESTPAIGSDGTIYFGCNNCLLLALNPNGKLKWQLKAENAITSSPAIGADGTIYVGCLDGKLYAVNQVGTLKWSYQTDNKIFTSPSIDKEGTIYFGNNDQKFYAINTDGTLKWFYKIGGSENYSSSVIDASGRIYVGGTNDQTMYAFNPDGSLYWSYKTGGGIYSSPIIGSNGSLYFNSDGEYLYALNIQKDKYEHDDEETPQSLKPVILEQTQTHNICPISDEDWYKFWGTMGLTYEFSSNSTTNYDTTAYIYNENNALQTSDDDSGSNGQFKISWTCPKFGYYYLKIVGKDPLTSGSYSINYNHTYQGIWSQRGRERTHKSHSYFTGPTTNVLKWKYKTGNSVISSPAIGADGTVYVGSYDFYLYAFNTNGTEKWKFKTDGEIYSSPAIGADGTVYVGSSDSYLYAINLNGTEKWKFKTGSKIYSSPAIGSDGTVYVGSYDNFLYALNPDGSEKWKFKTGSTVYSSPSIGSDGTVYMGSFDCYLYAINPDGTEKWKFLTGDSVYSSPAIGADDTVYVGSRDYYFYAINPNGTEKWKFKTGSDVYNSPAIGADGTVYVGSYDNFLYAFNPDGTEKWKFLTGSAVYMSSPAIGADGMVFVGSFDSYLYAINSAGALKWKYQTSSPINSSPAIGADGSVYVGSNDSNLYAIGPGEGY